MNKLKYIKRDSQKMKQSEAKEHNQQCADLHLNLLLTFVLRLEEQVKSQLGLVAGAYGGGVTEEWMRSSERHINNAISRIDTVVNETTDLRQKLQNHDQRLALLEGTIVSHRDLPMASTYASLQNVPLSGDISRRLTNAENASNNIEFLISETGRELNNIKQEVKRYIRPVVQSCVFLIEDLLFSFFH